ncbi:C-type lectin 37Da-like isoform X1 [Drosophila miranda]|uniref:C-type lectin 37Da-like isoform X1 n=1 Tax=Drosophila miranda TaxID=7229 RepID=UPI0007E71586|nr:C-type lectin 37Da-like isoform X1 [Drosophila miranda]
MLLRYTGLFAFACLGLFSPTGAAIIATDTDGISRSNLTLGPFVKIGNGLYYIEVMLQKNWFDAYESCRRMGAALISFETILEWHLINMYLFKMNIYDIYWTSGNNLSNGGRHTWHSTGAPVTLDIWAPGEPNNRGGNEHCDELGYLGTSTNYNVFNDKDCSVQRRYICEAL